MDKQKVNFLCPLDLLERIDECRLDLGLTRASFIIVACNDYIKAQDLVKKTDIFNQLNNLQKSIDSIK